MKRMRNGILRGSLLGLWLAVCPPAAFTRQEVVSLEQEKPLEREISPGQSHLYQFSLGGGQSFRLLVQTRRVDVALEVADDAGRVVAETNLTGVGGQEMLSRADNAGGSYRARLRGLMGGPAAGAYRLKLELWTQASPQDQRRITAEQLLNEARPLAESPVTAAQAVEKAEQALALWREAGEPYWETYSLNLLAVAWSSQARHEKALTQAEQALALARRLRDHASEAQALYNAGNSSRLLARLQPAREHFEQALAISREIGDRWNEGRGLAQLGIVLRAQGNREKSLEHYEQALAVNREVNDRAGEARTLNSLGVFYQQAEHVDKAIAFYEQGLALSRELKDLVMEARTLNNLSGLYHLTDQYEESLRVSERALAIHKANKDRAGEGRALSVMVNAWLYLGYHQKAIDLGQQALSIHREFKARPSEATMLHNLGNAYIRLNQFEQAAEYYRQALAIKREIKDRAGAMRSLIGVGNALAASGMYEEALRALNEALPLTRELKDRNLEAAALVGLGQAAHRQNHFAQAAEYYTQALILLRELRSRVEEARTLDLLGNAHLDLTEWTKAKETFELGLAISRDTKDQETESVILYGLAQAEAGRENNDRARDLYEQALRLTESLRNRFFNQGLRTSFFSSGHVMYTAYVELLMKMHAQRPTEGLAALALQASERARARNLLEQLAENRQDIRQGVEPALLEALAASQRKLNSKAVRRDSLAGGAQNAGQLAELDKEIAELVRDQDQVQARIRAQSPRYAALTQPQPLAAREIQGLLDADTVLLEYALDDKRSWLWLVTSTALESYRLPPRAEIESAVAELHRLLAQPKPDAGSEARLRERAQNLSRMLLAPVASQLGRKRLVIVATGALQYLPFAVLPEPGPRDAGPRPLLVEHEIVNLPSASTLAVLRRETAERRPAAKHVAVLADPVFDRNDPRVKAAGEAPATGSAADPSPQDHPLRDFRAQLGRLFFSRDEAEAIVAAAPAGMGFKALDFQANRATALDPNLADYRIVHFATHGLLNAEHPELSGLALSLVDEKGQPQDGFLRLHEIYNLKLNADLVVLSACQTALGKEIKSEGLIGLTRGFMYAGAPRVVASLWKVDDVATAELMKRFYRAMLQQNQRPAAALRVAQLEMMQRKRRQAPFYWAAFTLQGEWR